MKNINIIEVFEEKFNTFTPAQQRFSRYMLNNKYQASFLKAYEIAKIVNTHPSTIIRFIQSIGYSGYIDFQKDLRRIVTNQVLNYGQIEKAEKFNKNNSILQLCLNKAFINLKKLKEMLNERDVKKFVDIILNAERKFIIANRTSFSLSHFFYYKANLILKNTYLVNSFDGGIFNIFGDLNKDDLVIAISFPRYTKLTVDFAKSAYNENIKLISITDSKISPLYSISEMCLFCPYEGPTIQNSNVAGMALLDSIIGQIFISNKNIAINRLKKGEAALKNNKVIGFLDWI